MAFRIRSARPADLPQIYRVLGAAFDAPIQLFAAQTERDSTFRWRHSRLADLDGRIVAHVRIFARKMLVRGVPVRAGGIGSVATLPGYEGRGYATALLYDAIQQMHREGMAVAYLYTGRIGFYQRVGFRITRQPGFRADPAEAAAIGECSMYRVRSIRPADLPSLLQVYRSATTGVTGAIARTPGVWRDAQTWLDEDAAGTLLAEQGGAPIAYMRSRRRDHGYEVIDAEHLPGHERAIAALLARVARRATAMGAPIIASVPDDHALAAALRALPSTTWSAGPEHVPHPMMMRIVSLDVLLDRLLPWLRESARAHSGEPFTLTLRAPDNEHATLVVRTGSVSLRRREGAYALDEAGTLDALLGQHRASRLERPRPPRDVARRIDALFPQAAFHFWNSDRI